MVKRTMNCSIKMIADYWIENNDIPETELNFDWADAMTHCWNCGDDKQSSSGHIRLERAHIKPFALGGEDIPSNYVLLCKECHNDAPNNANAKHMWNWIKSNRTMFGLTGTYKTEKAFQQLRGVYGDSMFDHMRDVPQEEIGKAIRKALEGSNTHGFKMNISTIASVLSDVIESFKK